MTPGAIRRNARQFTAPRAWWLRTLETDVKRIEATPVPSARCTA